MSRKVLILKCHNRKLAFSIKKWHTSFSYRENCQNKHFIQPVFKKMIYLTKLKSFLGVRFSWLFFMCAKLSFLPHKFDPQTLADLAKFLQQGGAEPGLPQKSSQACRRLKPPEERWVKGRKPNSTISFPTNPLVFASGLSHLGPARQSQVKVLQSHSQLHPGKAPRSTGPIYLPNKEGEGR